MKAREMVKLRPVSAILIVSSLVFFPANATTEMLRGCFARTYSKTHLAEHPDQLVTAVKRTQALLTQTPLGSRFGYSDEVKIKLCTMKEFADRKDLRARVSLNVMETE
jgi:hypothetical protein